LEQFELIQGDLAAPATDEWHGTLDRDMDTRQSRSRETPMFGMAPNRPRSALVTGGPQAADGTKTD
ncbi:MAG: hypothetical protein M3P94_04075, partial [Chloroflexota bacterium]|nr:hypothetical protein [Chloroflexota bacterium]